MIQIEKGIPFPKVSSNKYPFAEMEVGDSIFLPNFTTTSISSNLQRFRDKFQDRKWSVRTVSGGVRVWRIQ